MIQIEDALWADLARYHLLDDPDPALPARIRDSMTRKAEAMARRQAYTAYRTATTPEDKAQALDRYLRHTLSDND